MLFIFYRENRWKKRGIAMTPTVFNLGYPVNIMLQVMYFIITLEYDKVEIVDTFCLMHINLFIWMST